MNSTLVSIIQKKMFVLSVTRMKNIPRGQGKKIHEHEKHLERKQNATEQKAKDKMRSLTDKNIQVINFDLQKVLVTPKRCLLQ